MPPNEVRSDGGSSAVDRGHDRKALIQPSGKLSRGGRPFVKTATSQFQTFYRTLKPSPVSGAVSPLTCSFGSANFACEWAQDPRDTEAAWRLLALASGRTALCATARVTSSASGRPAVTARLWSPLLSKPRPACIHMFFATFGAGPETPRLSILRHGVG